MERAIQTQQGSAADAFNFLLESVTDLMPVWVEEAKSNPALASTLLRLIQDDMIRSKRGKNDELLTKLAAIREAGSPKLAQIWSIAAKKAYGMQVLPEENALMVVQIPKKPWWQAGDGTLPRTLPKIPDVSIPGREELASADT